MVEEGSGGGGSGEEELVVNITRDRGMCVAQCPDGYERSGRNCTMVVER